MPLKQLFCKHFYVATCKPFYNSKYVTVLCTECGKEKVVDIFNRKGCVINDTLQYEK